MVSIRGMKAFPVSIANESTSPQMFDAWCLRLLPSRTLTGLPLRSRSRLRSFRLKRAGFTVCLR